MQAVIATILPDSIAQAVGLVPGDRIAAVNGRSDLEDLFDWRFEMADAPAITLHVCHIDGSEEVLDIEKDPDEDPGIVFQSPVFTPIKTCNNACPFCFIDQQPEGLRPNLYLKDDDWRLSYFVNTYITLTNLTPHDRTRITQLRPGPLYVSVHATDPEVRKVLLANPKFGGEIMKELSWLKSLEIPFHAQVVVCPGINDGEVLTQTLQDLATLRPEALSVAVVPVGLTKYRDDLPSLTAVTAEAAKAVVTQVEVFQKKAGRDFVFLSDEFYLKAGLPFPNYTEYGDFPQLDDGVGTARVLLQGFFKEESTLPKSLPSPRNVLLLTGKLGAMILQPIAARLNQIEGVYVDVMTVESAFWGEAVDVAGLVTGADILATLNKHNLSGYQAALLPAVMLKQDTEQFLDDVRVSEIEAKTGLPMHVIADAYSAKELVNAVLGTALPA